jgi:CPA2 family monovalent cation:H+ antiporter-2
VLTGQVVLVGHGRVGSRIAQALTDRNLPFVVAEENREVVEQLRAQNIPAVWGNASDPSVLIQAHVARAGMLVIATPDSFNVRKMVEIARTLNPAIEVVVRTHNEDEGRLLEQDEVGKVFIGEHELAQAMLGHVLFRMGHDLRRT